MGYYTEYTLDFEDINEYYFYESELRKITGFNPLETETKWNNWEGDMKELSNKYPKTLFKLEAFTRETGNKTKVYFKGGKMQICKAKITFEYYNEDKLK